MKSTSRLTANRPIESRKFLAADFINSIDPSRIQATLQQMSAYGVESASTARITAAHRSRARPAHNSWL
jgi:hypothetical protein